EHVSALSVRRGVSARVRVWLDPAPGVTGKYGVCLSPPARVGARACASQRGTGGGGGRLPLTVALHGGNPAPPGLAKVTVSAVAGPSRGRSVALLRITG